MTQTNFQVLNLVILQVAYTIRDIAREAPFLNPYWTTEQKATPRVMNFKFDILIL